MTRRHSIVFAAIGAMMMALPAAPAQAEKLEFDFRLYPPLKAALDNQHAGTIYYDASKRGQVMDRILITGQSAERDWTEALEMLVVRRIGTRGSPEEWLARFKPASETPCSALITRVSGDATSLTFALDAPACPAGGAFSGLYRVVYSRKTVYLLAAKLKGKMSASQREQWLALLASAHLSG